VRVTSVKNSFCGFIPSLTQQRYGLQARQTSGWDFTLLFDDDSLLDGSRHTHAGRVKTRLRSQGAGINYNDIAARGYRASQAGSRPRPARSSCRGAPVRSRSGLSSAGRRRTC